MSKFNEKATATLHKVSEYFDKPIRGFQPIPSPQSVGIELEVKFKYFFPELFEKYFKDIAWQDRPSYQKKEIEKVVTEEEKDILAKLEKTKELGINTGNDCYWEFALDPVDDLSIILKQVHLLHDIGALPKGTHSMHITVGNVENDKNTYWLLLLSELLFSSESRMKAGISEKGRKAYFRKGTAGLLEKRFRLVDCKVASELRSLELVIGHEMSMNWVTLNLFSRLLNFGPEFEYKIKKAKEIFNIVGLPDQNWGNYHDNPEVWNKYFENFDKIRSFVFFETIDN